MTRYTPRVPDQRSRHHLSRLMVAALALGAAALPLATAGTAQALTADHTIAVGADPAGIAFSPDGATAYVANSDDASVSFIDVATHTVTYTTGFVYTASVETSPDGSLLYVTADSGNGGITVFNTATHTQVAQSNDPGYAPRMAVSPDGTRLYSANDRTDTLTVSNASTLATVATIAVGSNPVDVRVSPDGQTAYVLNRNDHSVSVVNLTTNTVSATIPVADYPLQEVLSPDGSSLYVVDNDLGYLSVIDTASDTVRATDTLNFFPYAIDVSPDGSKLYITGDDNILHVVDPATGATTDTGDVPGTAYNVALTPSGSEAWVVNMAYAVVTTFGLTSPPVAEPGVPRARFLSSTQLLTDPGNPAATLSSLTPKICVVDGSRVATLATAGTCRVEVHQSGAVVLTKSIRVRKLATNSTGVRLMHVASAPFAVGQAGLGHRTRAVLHAHLAQLRAADQVVVLGLAARPTAHQTGSVSRRRAAVVRDYLVAHGVTVSATRHVAHALHLRGPQPQTRRALVAWR